MAEADEVKSQNVETKEIASATKEQETRSSRRKFLRRVLAVTSGIGLAEYWRVRELYSKPVSLPVEPQATCPTPAPPTMQAVGEITRNGNKLEAVMQVVSGPRYVPTSSTATTPTMLRYYKGHNPHPAKQSESWPPGSATVTGPAVPGPTLRCEIGDIVQITFLNQVNIEDFPGSTFAGDVGTATGCDQATKVRSDGGTIRNWYPKDDKFPNCFHASSAANIHFHGTHVTPSTTGDNVLVNVWPNDKVNEKDVRTAFAEIFAQCDLLSEPKKWLDLPLTWRRYQETLVKEYDQKAPYTGPDRNPNGHGLPSNLQLWPMNEQVIAQNKWPTYYVGSYPYCFQIPKYTVDEKGNSNFRMGQAPGTHWYHSHKHGSTALNMFNGLSGALIIEDNSLTGYDGKLKDYYGKLGFTLRQTVIVFQQIMPGAAPERPDDKPTPAVANLLAGKGGPPPVLVNGQFTPTITMRPGQVLLWRMINATVQRFLNASFRPCAGTTTLSFKQTAQDGVQFSPANYKGQPTGSRPLNNMAPANRIDLLVQAPTTTGLHVLQDADAKIGPILYVNVTGDPITPPMPFPTPDDFPRLPKFLGDIEDKEIFINRRVVYGWEPQLTDPVRPGRNNATGGAPKYTIDGNQFEDRVINQVMRVDTSEEWTVYNETTGVPNTGNPPIEHPFHIHVNPFQIVEKFDPWTMDKPERYVSDLDTAKNKYGNTKTLIERAPIWWDTFAIPAAKMINDKLVSGYFTMRTRFVDFTGQYVQHCHILAHEDRGMMQLLEVVSNETIIKHH